MTTGAGGEALSLNRVRDLLESGKPAFGAIVTMPSPQVVQVMARAGFDLLLFDMEHGPIDLATVCIAGVTGPPVGRRTHQ